MRRLLHEVIERYREPYRGRFGRYPHQPIFINLTISCTYEEINSAEHHVKRILDFFLKSGMYILHRINVLISNIMTIPYCHVYWLL